MASKASAKHKNARAGLLAVGLLIVYLTPLGAAQFGGQLKAGDFGHVPVTKGASVPLKILYGGMGDASTFVDDCVYIDVTSPTTLNDGLTNKDLRLTRCGEKASGTAINDADTIEKATTPAYIAVSVRYVDVNGNGKYDKGDLVYITTNVAADTLFPASTDPTTWTIRLTPALAYPAGTFVMIGDQDAARYRNAAVVLTSSMVEREDSIWFLINHAAGAAPFDAKGALILGDSIRINANAAPQPAFKVTKLDLGATEMPAGSSFTAKAEVQNTGKGAGMGIVVSKVNGIMVDAQLTPFLSPGEKGTITVKGFVPMTGTSAAFEVGEQFKQLTILNGTRSVDVDMESLLARVMALEAEINLLKAGQDPTLEGNGGAIKAQNAGAVRESSAPGFLGIVALVAVALLVARRKA